jgi:hypothetical protein
MFVQKQGTYKQVCQTRSHSGLHLRVVISATFVTKVFGYFQDTSQVSIICRFLCTDIYNPKSAVSVTLKLKLRKVESRAILPYLLLIMD